VVNAVIECNRAELKESILKGGVLKKGVNLAGTDAISAGLHEAVYWGHGSEVVTHIADGQDGGIQALSPLGSFDGILSDQFQIDFVFSDRVTAVPRMQRLANFLSFLLVIFLGVDADGLFGWFGLRRWQIAFSFHVFLL
jgi:hypothetical protein